MTEEEIKVAIDLIKFYTNWYISEATWTDEVEKEVLKEQDFLIDMIKKQREKKDEM